MSSQRGNPQKNKAPKHANKTAFKNDLHDTNKRTKAIRELAISGCCDKCTKVIQWKIKYKKYKPLTQPRRCVRCQGKTVLNAYNIICTPCVKSNNVCGKCTEPLPAADESKPVSSSDNASNEQSNVIDKCTDNASEEQSSVIYKLPSDGEMKSNGAISDIAEIIESNCRLSDEESDNEDNELDSEGEDSESLSSDCDE